MWHSVKQIGERYEKLSILRKDKKPFLAKDFLQYASLNIKKYNLLTKEDDFLVTTFYSDNLINDYRNELKK